VTGRARALVGVEEGGDEVKDASGKAKVGSGPEGRCLFPSECCSQDEGVSSSANTSQRPKLGDCWPSHIAKASLPRRSIPSDSSSSFDLSSAPMFSFPLQPPRFPGMSDWNERKHATHHPHSQPRRPRIDQAATTSRSEPRSRPGPMPNHVGSGTEHTPKAGVLTLLTTMRETSRRRMGE
jgi:hypothetical protein